MYLVQCYDNPSQLIHLSLSISIHHLQITCFILLTQARKQRDGTNHFYVYACSKKAHLHSFEECLVTIDCVPRDATYGPQYIITIIVVSLSLSREFLVSLGQVSLLVMFKNFLLINMTSQSERIMDARITKNNSRYEIWG